MSWNGLSSESNSIFFRSGNGSHYDTFSGPVAAFSPQGKPKKPYISPGRNFITNPSKKGTGYGYVHVTIGKPQQHAPEPYDRAKEIMKVFTVSSPLSAGGGGGRGLKIFQCWQKGGDLQFLNF